ncbi:hypothetical protein EF808_03930 [archaeon]|nr:MAG: hypothetical protein EF808_03930 [archaeon]
MDVRRPMSAVGGLLLVVASFLPYGYETWASESLFSLMRDVLAHLNDYDYLEALLLQIGPSYGTSGFILGLVIASFFLLFIGGILGVLHIRGGSLAGPAAMIILTLIPLYRDGTAGLSSLGSGFYVGWAGAILCGLTLFMEERKLSKEERRRRDTDRDTQWEDDHDRYEEQADDQDDDGGDEGD